MTDRWALLIIESGKWELNTVALLADQHSLSSKCFIFVMWKEKTCSNYTYLFINIYYLSMVHAKTLSLKAYN